MTQRTARRGTPATLRMLSVLVLVAGWAGGASGWLALSDRAGSVAQARADARQLARLEIVRTTLVVADAAAGDDVLRGTSPAGSQDRQFGYALQPAVTGLNRLAANSDEPDTLALAALRVTRWSATAETARTLARQGDPGAVRTLRSASQTLRSGVLPVVSAAQDHAADALRRDGGTSSSDRTTGLAGLAGLVALALLAGTHGWLSVRFRRVLVPLLATAAVVALLAAAAAAQVVHRSESRARAVTSGPAAVARGLVDVRTLAFEARAAEALGVVTGTTPVTHDGWRTAVDGAAAGLGRAAATAGPVERDEFRAAAAELDAYEAVHATLLDAAAGGRRDAEVAVALDRSTRGAVGAFDGFDARTGALLARQVQAADDGWADAGRLLVPTAWTVLAAGVLAGLLAAAAVRARLAEYR